MVRPHSMVKSEIRLQQQRLTFQPAQSNLAGFGQSNNCHLALLGYQLVLNLARETTGITSFPGKADLEPRATFLAGRSASAAAAAKNRLQSIRSSDVGCTVL